MKSNQPMAAPSMNRPTTFVTFDIYIYIYHHKSQSVCVCNVHIVHVQCTFTVIVTVHCTMKMSWLLLPLCLSVERSQLLHGASVYHNIISDFVSKCSVCRVCCALSIGSQVENWNWMISDHVQVCFRSQMRL